ncbi:MAG: hypothetical protein NTY48_03215 [Candidatus Diapherotrites archaeon]|nr:hypothetical protein [Candidatus Diapherotrites archaeon]
MKISIVSLKDNSVNVTPALGKALLKRISGLELGERFAHFAEDIPAIALECAVDSDFVVVFALVDEESLVGFLKEKLVEVELSTKTRILKWVLEDPFSGTDEYVFKSEKETMVDEMTEMIVNILFNERAFMPKEKDFYA